MDNTGHRLQDYEKLEQLVDENNMIDEDEIRESKHHHHSHHSHHHESSHSRSKKKKKRVWLIVLIVFLVLALAVAGTAVYFMSQYIAASNDEKIESKYTDEELGIDPMVAENLEGYRNIVIYGLDGTKRSDVMLLISIDKETKQGKMTTVYRDTYMQLNPEKAYTIAEKERDFFKCNHAYKKGGKIVSIKMLNRHLDLNVRECLGLNWDAVASLVEELDGIDVKMTYSLAAFINKQMDEENKVSVTDGYTRLNGKQAVAYLRARKDPGSTAATRSMRNEMVFLDLFERAQKMDKEELLGIFKAVVGKTETNMSMRAMLNLLKDLRSYKLEALEGWPYDYSILWDDAYYYYVPESLKSNVSELHWNLFGENEYKPSETCKALSKEIKNNRTTILK